MINEVILYRGRVLSSDFIKEDRDYLLFEEEGQVADASTIASVKSFFDNKASDVETRLSALNKLLQVRNKNINDLKTEIKSLELKKAKSQDDYNVVSVSNQTVTELGDAQKNAKDFAQATVNNKPQQKAEQTEQTSDSSNAIPNGSPDDFPA